MSTKISKSIKSNKHSGFHAFIEVFPDSAGHSALTRGALGEVVNLTKPMIESGLWGLDRPCASLITLCSSHLGHFYGQKLPKMAIFGYIGHKRVLDAPNGWNEVEQGWNK